MIQINQLSKSFSDQVLFKNATFQIGKGERIGLVGRNGSGKTTLFKMILGEEAIDEGQISFPKNYTIQSLKQHLDFKFPTILEEALSVFKKEDQEFNSYKAEKMLMGLGFALEDFSKSPMSFSGGFQIRLNLAKVLLTEPDCLLLDEPTNYLDIISLRWLQKFLREFKGELILITHDRGFMNEVCTHTVGIWREKILKVQGSTHKYYHQVALEEEVYERTRQNEEKKRKDLEGFVERFRAKASKAAQAQSRLKQLEKMPYHEALKAIQVLDFEFQHVECPGKVLLEAKKLTFGYGEENLISDLTISIGREDKIAIIGKNGKGKSTLLNLLAKELTPKDGEVHHNINLKLGHFGQTNVNRLGLEQTIEEELVSSEESVTPYQARSVAATMMFSGDLSQKKIKVLSGGERARVLLGKILLKPTNLLLLDEPTNHLDQDSIEALITQLKEYPGAVIVVTHSEEMISEIATKLIVFHQNRVEYFPFGYTEFLEKIGWDSEIKEEKEIKKSTLGRQEMKRLRSELIIQRGREINPHKKEMEEAEKKIIQLEAEEKSLENDLFNPDHLGNTKEIQEKSIKLAKIKKEIEAQFERLELHSNIHQEIIEKYDPKLKELE